MVLIVLRGLNAQNNEEQLLFDKKNLGAEKMGPNAWYEFPNNTTTSLEYFLLSITVTFMVDNGPLAVKKAND